MLTIHIKTLRNEKVTLPECNVKKIVNILLSVINVWDVCGYGLTKPGEMIYTSYHYNISNDLITD